MSLPWFLEGDLFPSFLLSNQFNFPFVCFILARFPSRYRSLQIQILQWKLRLLRKVSISIPGGGDQRCSVVLLGPLQNFRHHSVLVCFSFFAYPAFNPLGRVQNWVKLLFSLLVFHPSFVEVDLQWGINHLVRLVCRGKNFYIH